ncbi:cytochrome P450 [Microbacterium immunditiarum]|uniref:Cytochrome P450 n=1 Tax=Microbacterium immunditiarum TaxID=337480 RepID=A0A7Y9GK44_9MICO|nr:cytochrome P450 [Microbacterium immunditiarum]NYE18001.1 cytochrome P450 [Microbacterium immunditiarum]
MTIPAECPFHSRSLPGDGTPLTPSPQLAAWREEGAFVPLDFQDGHEGLVATRYEAAVAVLQDPRFSMRPSRMPVGPPAHGEEGKAESAAVPLEAPGELDASGQASDELNLLNLDGQEHAKLRRAVTARFSVRQARAREPWIRAMVAEQITALRERGSVVDLRHDYAMPISARTHCHIIGIPEHHYERFVSLFVEESTAQQKYDFIRALLEERRDSPGEDVITDLLQDPELDRVEIEALLRLLMGAGRDSVAYLIATASVALLTNPEQLAILRADPAQIRPAVEEFMRVGAMFVTLFARTALEDVEVEGTRIPAGTSVSVSPVAANRDPGHWGARSEEFDVTRDAFGHLGFGYGIHGCIGQQIARVEIREAITALLESFPELALVDAEQLTPQPFAHPVAVYEAGTVTVRLGAAA